MTSSVLSKGQVLTDYYRLLTRYGGYVWLQTCATMIVGSKGADEQNIIAINYILRCVCACVQVSRDVTIHTCGNVCTCGDV